MASEVQPFDPTLMPSPMAQQAILQSRQNGSAAGGFTGDFCPDCGQAAMVRNGSCLVCTLCGATTGCS